MRDSLLFSLMSTVVILWSYLWYILCWI